MFYLCFTSIFRLISAQAWRAQARSLTPQGHPLVDAYVEYLRAFQPRLQAMVSLIEKAASMAMGPGWVAQDFPHDEFSIEYCLVVWNMAF